MTTNTETELTIPKNPLRSIIVELPMPAHAELAQLKQHRDRLQAALDHCAPAQQRLRDLCIRLGAECHPILFGVIVRGEETSLTAFSGDQLLQELGASVHESREVMALTRRVADRLING